MNKTSEGDTAGRRAFQAGWVSNSKAGVCKGASRMARACGAREEERARYRGKSQIYNLSTKFKLIFSM